MAERQISAAVAGLLGRRLLEPDRGADPGLVTAPPKDCGHFS